MNYILALVHLLIKEDFSIVENFHCSSISDPYTPFLRLLQRQQTVSQELSALALAAILSTRPDKTAMAIHASQISENGSSNGTMTGDGVISSSSAAIVQIILSFIDWICGQLRKPSEKQPESVIHALAVLLYERGVRPAVLKAGCVPLIVKQLKLSNSSSFQMLYEAGLCVYLLSFLPSACEELKSSGACASLVEIARTAQKEKVVRVIILSLRNMLLCDENRGTSYGTDLSELGLVKVVASLKLGAWKDEELLESLDYLEEKLSEVRSSFTTFDRYKREVLSGSLSWTQVHTDPSFWKENISKFEERDWQIVRVLLKLLEMNKETKTLSVACHDIGKFIESHENGRFIIQRLMGKEIIMKLMAHPDLEVQKQALLCVQKLMLSKNKLDFLASSQL